MSKSEVTKSKKEAVLHDLHGPEKKFWRSWAGRADLPLGKLSRCESVFTTFNPSKVKGIKKSLLENFEPNLVR